MITRLDKNHVFDAMNPQNFAATAGICPACDCEWLTPVARDLSHFRRRLALIAVTFTWGSSCAVTVLECKRLMVRSSTVCVWRDTNCNYRLTKCIVRVFWDLVLTRNVFEPKGRGAIWLNWAWKRQSYGKINVIPISRTYNNLQGSFIYRVYCEESWDNTIK
jgi:hypothetical protein